MDQYGFLDKCIKDTNIDLNQHMCYYVQVLCNAQKWILEIP
jgi:hypothetical protein